MQKTQDKHSFKKSFIAILFVSMIVGEVLYSFYSNEQNGIESIKAARDADVESFLQSSEAVRRRNSRDRDIEQLDASTDSKQKQNDAALAKSLGKAVINVFDDKIRADKKAKQGIMDKYDTWEKERVDTIISDYESRIGAASGLSSNIYLSLTASLLAIGLSYLATRQGDRWRWIILAGAFLAQLFVSSVIYDGTMLKYGSEAKAFLAAAVFFFCVPLAYHFGIIDYNSSLPMSGITLSHSNGKHTTSITVWSQNREGWIKAIIELAKERNLGNGSGMLSEIAEHFQVNKGVVCRAVKLAQSGRPINVPKKLSGGKSESCSPPFPTEKEAV